MGANYVLEILRVVVAVIEVYYFQNEAQGGFVFAVFKGFKDIDKVGFVFVDHVNVLFYHVQVHLLVLLVL